MEVGVAKGLSIVVLFVLSLLFGWLPIILFYKKVLSAEGSPRRKLVLDLLNCFAGGVFLGICLLSLLAEGLEEFQEYRDLVGLTIDFPFYELLVGVGVFLVAAVEKVGFAIVSSSTKNALVSYDDDHSPDRGQHEEEHGSHQVDEQRLQPKRDEGQHEHGSPPILYVPRNYGSLSATSGAVITPFAVSPGESDLGKKNLAPSGPEAIGEHGWTYDGVFSPGGEGLAPARNRPSNRARNLSWSMPTAKGSILPAEAATEAPRRRSLPTPTWHGVGGSPEARDLNHQHHHHSLLEVTVCTPTDISQVSAVRALLLLLALSFHTVFDGLAVGLQKDVYSVWEVLLAISVHKSLVAFCLGLELTEAAGGRLKRPLVFMFLFALISPAGIAIGMGVTSGNVDMAARLLTSCVLQSLATGTFLYVTFFEILGQQFAHHASDHAHDHASGHAHDHAHDHAPDHAHDHGHTHTWMALAKIGLAAVGFACMAGVNALEAH